MRKTRSRSRATKKAKAPRQKTKRATPTPDMDIQDQASAVADAHLRESVAVFHAINENPYLTDEERRRRKDAYLKEMQDTLDRRIVDKINAADLPEDVKLWLLQSRRSTTPPSK